MPYHPQTNGLVEEITPENYAHDQEAGRRQKVNWPSHLAEIVHTYNATHSAVTRYSPHCWQQQGPHERGLCQVCG